MKTIESANLKEKFFECKELGEISFVKDIIQDVKQNGDDALVKYTAEFDNAILEKIDVNSSEIKKAYEKVDETVISSIRHIANNIQRFSQKQLSQFRNFEYEIVPGVFVGQKVLPIEKVGIYVPGGRFPLASTLLMCAIPAKVAGVKEIIVCSPPSYGGSIHPIILVAADMVGIDKIYNIGGVQAIAAMAYGTQTVKKVDKIVGPGNRFIIQAKKEVNGVVGIDFLAGPTEIMIIADEYANPKILAADLLAQAEHDIDALPILLTNSWELAKKVNKEISSQLSKLETKKIAGTAINKNGLIIIVQSIDEAIHIANKKAPEHLELQIKNANMYINKLQNYGSLFVGENSAVALGDYSSGINHTLPTNGCARYTGGLSVKDFLKFQTILQVKENGLKRLGPIAKVFAEIEGLAGHRESIEIRIDKS